MKVFSMRRLRTRLKLVQGKLRFGLWVILCTLCILLADYFLGLVATILEKDFETDFSYPLDVDNFPALIENFRNGEAVEYEPINRLYSKPKFVERADSHCDKFQLMVIMVKSAPSNLNRRKAIRSTWGNPHYLKNISNLIRAKKLMTNSNNNRFSLPKKQTEPNVYFKLVFLVGLIPTNTDQQAGQKPIPEVNIAKKEKAQKFPRNDNPSNVKVSSNEASSFGTQLDEDIRKESLQYKDIVRLGTVDTYSNNTFKTMMGLRWASEICTDFEYALLVDDDMYISIKNLLLFIESPATYPDGELEEFDSETVGGRQIVDANRLFAGKVLFTKPVRQRIGSYSKWYLSLEEYPYNYFPRYMPAAAIVMSKQVVEDFYYASFYTKHFRFDDIFLGIMAYKMNIIPYSSSYFHVCHSEDGKCPGLVIPTRTRTKGFLDGGSSASYEEGNSEDLSVVEQMEHVIARHGLNPRQLIDLWRELTLAGKI